MENFRPTLRIFFQLQRIADEKIMEKLFSLLSWKYYYVSFNNVVVVVRASNRTLIVSLRGWWSGETAECKPKKEKITNCLMS